MFIIVRVDHTRIKRHAPTPPPTADDKVDAVVEIVQLVDYAIWHKFEVEGWNGMKIQNHTTDIFLYFAHVVGMVILSVDDLLFCQYRPWSIL